MKKNPLRVISILAALLGVFFVVSCSEAPDIRTAPIAALTIEDYNAWLKQAAEKFTSSEMQEFENCIGEIKLGIMQRKEASGVERVAQAMCDRINGKTPREVLILGYTTTTEWVTKELTFQRANLKAAETTLSRSNNETTKTGLRDYCTIARDNIENKLEPKLARAQARLAELQATQPSTAQAR